MNQASDNPLQSLATAMTPKFAVSYLRVSTRGQAERGGGADEGFSIPAQREANKKKVLFMGAMVGKEFVDRGTGSKYRIYWKHIPTANVPVNTRTS